MGSLKEMQRWAYEIHSSFLVPGAPLRIHQLQESIVNDIDRYTNIMPNFFTTYGIRQASTVRVRNLLQNFYAL